MTGFGAGAPLAPPALPGPGSVLMPTRNGNCSCGAPWAAATDEASSSGRNPIVYGLSRWVEVCVKQLRCVCGLVRGYDGCADGILNLNNMDLFTHELLQW